MFNKLKSQPLKIKPSKETMIMNRVLENHSEQEDHVSLFSDAAHQDKGLRQWVANQRRNLRAGKRQFREQIDLLNKMNFIWNPHKHMWNILLNELRECRKKNGHCFVPKRTYSHFPRLGSWVNFIRLRKKNQEKESPSLRVAFLTYPCATQKNESVG